MNALITGATSGIGLSFAKLLSKKGYNLILVGRDSEKLERVKLELEQNNPITVKTYQLDLSKKEEIDEFICQIIKSNIILKLVINNAGIGCYGKFNSYKIEKDRETIEINVQAVTHITKGLYPCYIKGTRIIQVASTAGFAPGAYMGVYYASKAYVLSLSLALREEWKSEGIGVCVLCPGPTQTEFQQRAKMKKAEFTKHFMMSPKQVVQQGYEGMIRNKAIIIPGYWNYGSARILDLLPIQVATQVVKYTQKK